jgi:hypothetical protein
LQGRQPGHRLRPIRYFARQVIQEMFCHLLGDGAVHLNIGVGVESGLLIQHIQSPLAKLFGNGRPGKHAEQMTAAQGEDTNLAHLTCILVSRMQLDQRGHRVGEFVGVAIVEIGDSILLTVSQGFSDLRRLMPLASTTCRYGGGGLPGPHRRIFL